MTHPAGQRLLACLRLCRAEYWGFSVTAPLGALLVAGASLPVETFAVLFVINMLTVAWGFAHNDYCDLALDLLSADKTERVLVRGDLGPAGALALVIVLMLASLALALASWPFPSMPTALLLLAIVATALYNRYGKSFVGGDVFYALAGSSLFLMGAVAATPGHEIALLSPVIWIVYLVQFLNHFYFNAINGGIKDASTDREHGVPTLVATLTRIEGREIEFSRTLRVLAMSLALSIVALTAVPILFLGMPWHAWQVAIMALCGLGSIVQTWRLVQVRRHDRDRIGGMLVRREMLTTGMIMMLLPALVGMQWIATLLAIPFAVYLGFNRLLNRTGLALPRNY